MAVNETVLLAGGGFLLALISVVWLWRSISKPDIVDKLYRRVERMQAEIDALRADMSSDCEEMTELKIEMAEWRHGMALNFEQMKRAGLTPVWTPRETEARPKNKRADAPLAHRIAEKFSMSEIDSLAYDIGILPEEFPGTTAEARARELVDLASRRGITAALLGRVDELRGKTK